MYTPYLFFAYVAALALALLGFAVVRRSVPDLRGMIPLRRFVSCALLAVILFGLRWHAPALLTIVLPNCLLFAGTGFLYLAVAEILEVAPRQLKWIVGCCAVAVPAVAWFTYGHADEIARLEIHCAVLVAGLGICCVPLFRERRIALRPPAQACGSMLVTSIAVNAGWGVHGLLHAPKPSFLQLDAFDAMISYLVMILAVGEVVSLAWLSFCVHREELRNEAQTDALTGLLNRGAFVSLLRHELARPDCNLGLMFVDVDFFKQVNDSHGHLVGDDVLRRVGSTLREGLRPNDVLARYGGEEFVVLVRGAGLETAEEIAERLRASIEALDDLPRGLALTASFGVAVTRGGEDVEELLNRADEALYRSKREGRNLVRVDESAGRLGSLIGQS